MPEKSGFFTTGKTDGSPYPESSTTAFIEYQWGRNNNSHRGIIGNSANGGMKVTQRAAGVNLSVDVEGGAAYVKGYYYYNTATTNLLITAGHATLGRYDLVILRASIATGGVRVVILEGTPAASPVDPTLTRTSSTWEIRLARISVAAAASFITNANITNLQEYADVPNFTGFLHTNSNGSIVPRGYALSQSVAGVGGIVATVADRAILGITTEETTNGEEVMLCTHGECYVITETAVTRGDIGQVSVTTPGQLRLFNGRGIPLGVFLETASAGAMVRFLYNPTQRYSLSAHVRHNANQAVPTSGTSSSLAFNTETFDGQNIHDNVTNNTRLTPGIYGKYYVWANVKWAQNITGERQLRLAKNGDTTNWIGAAFLNVANNPANPEMIVDAYVNLTATDYVEVYGLQTSGGSLNIISSTNYSPEFGLVWLEPYLA